MQETVCKNCNAPLNVGEAKNGVVVCPFCQSVYTLPKKEQTAEVLSYLRMGENELNSCAFERAYTAFSKAIELDETEPEGYFGRALARFCVQYLKDTVNNRLQPICHEISDKVFSQDADYQKALRAATPEQRKAYENKAEEIDYIRNEFFALRQKGLSYDCFICVKVSDENGNPTRDSMTATKLYVTLKNEGYKPFYSEYEIAGRTGADYEALILYALYSAPCMLIVCTDGSYLETKWVKNEYTRFLSLINDEVKEKDGITFVFEGKPIERLPGVNGKIQGVDFKSFDALVKIKKFIDGHDAEKQRMKREQDEAERAEKERAAKEREEAERRRTEEAEKRASEMEKRLKELEELAKRGAEAAPAVRQEPVKQTVKPVSPAPAVRQQPAKQAVKPASSAPAARQEPAKQALPISDFEIKDGVLIKYTGNGGDVVIPEGITEIGGRAFYSCSSVKSVEIPEGVTLIKGGAFESCKYLKSVIIPESVTEIWYNAFKFCTSLTSVKIPEGVTEIGDDAFSQCKSLTSVNIPVSVSKIGKNAFAECAALTSVVIPRGVTEIGCSAFYGCSSLTSVAFPEGVKIRNHAFAYCASLASVVIPEKVAEIGDGAFESCNSLTNIVLPESLTNIGANAFRGCKSLPEVIIPKSVEQIGREAFRGCTSLQEAIIPKSVENIGENAFLQCDRLTIRCARGFKPSGWHSAWNGGRPVRWGISSAADFQIENGVLVKYLGEGGDVTIPAGVKAIGKKAFIWTGMLQSVVIPEGVTEIGEDAFLGCHSLKNAEIPEGVTRIGSGAFHGCFSLTRVFVPAGVIEIESSTFFNCNKLGQVVLPSGIVKIGYGAFQNCSTLSEVNIPQSVKQIDRLAFAGCLALERVVLPAGIEFVGQDAFENISADSKEGAKAKITVCVPLKKPLFGVPKGWHKNWAAGAAVVWNYREPADGKASR